jgi:hypothetical protein
MFEVLEIKLIFKNILKSTISGLRALATDTLYGIPFPMFREKRKKTTKTPPQ